MLFFYECTCNYISDTEPPYYTFCPQRIAQDLVGDAMRVTWNEPVFQDNSGEIPSITLNRANGGWFKEGQHLVLHFQMSFCSPFNQLILKTEIFTPTLVPSNILVWQLFCNNLSMWQ